MPLHKDLTNAELHEPKHIQIAVAADKGKVITPTGIGTSELRFLLRTEVPQVHQALSDLEDIITDASFKVYAGVLLNESAPTATIQIAVEKKEYYMIGPATGQTFTIKLPPPAATNGMSFKFKRLNANGTIAVIPNATELIEGFTSVTITGVGGLVALVSDGVNWRQV